MRSVKSEGSSRSNAKKMVIKRILICFLFPRLMCAAPLDYRSTVFPGFVHQKLGWLQIGSSYLVVGKKTEEYNNEFIKKIIEILHESEKNRLAFFAYVMLLSD